VKVNHLIILIVTINDCLNWIYW